jgi:hypothetical protein
MQRISGLAKALLNPQDVFLSIDLVTWLVGWLVGWLVSEVFRFCDDVISHIY